MSEVVDNYGWAKRAALTADAHNADQAEVEAIKQTIVATAISMYDERLAEELEPEGNNLTRIDEQMLADVELDSLSGRIIEEIQRRVELLGENYPFTLIDGSLEYTPSKTGVYEFCLAVSTAPNLTTGNFVELARYFEILAGDVVCHYMGVGSKFIRSGAPAYPQEALIRTFKGAIDHLHSETGEWCWSPSDEAEADLAAIKDEGMDFVVWKSLDRRKGRLFVLGQCACGRTDWHQKTDDLNLSRIKRWVRELPPVQPIRAFATPHNVTATLVFGTLSTYAGLSFDRIRLTAVANSPMNRDHFSVKHAPTLLRLTQLVIAEARLAEVA
ncbi:MULTISPECIES: hypothetical protein [Janthinobacterium]|uniref:Uncharacterized protein n=1 Tax=Janthinobacterium lividum TaxID=29581 RepID=A0A5C4NUR0_9BURK|nr:MULTISPECIES: hypothetical protein [Janthinobacterium]MBB5610765.1 hypothetical protein [Janthinobacterium sp. S3T4]MBB5616251.1 hypothetical protein [Janthinobacterium sp. S3M3]TNC77525.1 hypothetical protein FHI69_09320 [Janthinobacterium lividum]